MICVRYIFPRSSKTFFEYLTISWKQVFHAVKSNENERTLTWFIVLVFVVGVQRCKYDSTSIFYEVLIFHNI